MLSACLIEYRAKSRGSMSRMRSPSTTELPLAIEFRVPVAGIEADLTSYARSQYRAQLLGGFWRIVAITSIYERERPRPVSARYPPGHRRAGTHRLPVLLPVPVGFQNSVTSPDLGF